MEQYKVGSISEIIAKSCASDGNVSSSSSFDPNLCQLFKTGTETGASAKGSKNKKKKGVDSESLTPRLVKTSETFSSSKTKIQSLTPATANKKKNATTSKLTHKEAAAFRLQKKNKVGNKTVGKVGRPGKTGKPALRVPVVSSDAEEEADSNNSDVDAADDDQEIENKASGSDSKKEKDKKTSFKVLNAPKEKDSELECRTLYIGNVPKEIKKIKLKKLFGEYGKIESIRFRCAAPAKPTTLKKIAIRKNEIHPDRNSLVSFVRFSSREEAEKAADGLNGFQLNEHHLTVNLADTGKKDRDNKKAVFIGNLHLKTSDDELWSLFQDCGKISGVRIVRDSATGLGKGFGYINFEDSSSVENALKFEGKEVRGREIRVSRAVKKLKSKTGKKKSQGQRQRSETIPNPQSKTSAKKESFSGDYLSEIGKLKRKGNKINRGEMKKARIAKQLTGNSNSVESSHHKTKNIRYFSKTGTNTNPKKNFNTQNPKTSKSNPHKNKGMNFKSNQKSDRNHKDRNFSLNNKRGGKSKPGKRK